MLSVIDSGLTGPRVGAARMREMRWSLAWLAATITAAAATGVMVGKGEFKFAALPVVGLLAAAFARVPPPGTSRSCGASGRAVDMLALPEVGVSSLQFVPAEVLLWIALGSLLFLRGDVRRALSSLAMRRESARRRDLLGRSRRWRRRRRRERCEPPRSHIQHALHAVLRSVLASAGRAGNGSPENCPHARFGECRGGRHPPDPPGDRGTVDAPVPNRQRQT